MDSKPWYASKTIWANMVAFAATMAMVFGLDLPFDLTAEVQAEIVAAVMAVVNIALRFVTDTSIGGE
ncbi:MAG: hypothetical protein OEN55_15640 [Alphaproteobacteria bacterium]|nr:hypothetical protein [Alphaproteobacteria bacterium]